VIAVFLLLSSPFDPRTLLCVTGLRQLLERHSPTAARMCVIVHAPIEPSATLHLGVPESRSYSLCRARCRALKNVRPQLTTAQSPFYQARRCAFSARAARNHAPARCWSNNETVRPGAVLPRGKSVRASHPGIGKRRVVAPPPIRFIFSANRWIKTGPARNGTAAFSRTAAMLRAPNQVTAPAVARTAKGRFLSP